MIAQPGAVEVYMAVPEREPRGYSWAGVISIPPYNDRKASSPEWNRTFSIIHWLVVTGTMEFYDFPEIVGNFIPTDEFIFFRGVGIPPTSSVCADNFLVSFILIFQLVDLVPPSRELRVCWTWSIHHAHQTEWKNIMGTMPFTQICSSQSLRRCGICLHGPIYSYLLPLAQPPSVRIQLGRWALENSGPKRWSQVLLVWLAISTGMSGSELRGESNGCMARSRFWSMIDMQIDGHVLSWCHGQWETTE